MELEAVVLPHLDAAYTLARYLMGDDADAQDVVQDAALRAVKHFAGFRGKTGSDARAWFLTIVRNAAYTWRRRRRREALDTEFNEEFHSEGDAVVDPAAVLDIQQALAGLPLEFREVIVLRELEGLSYREIADVTGVPVGTVMSRLARARKRLQQTVSVEERT